MSSKYIVPDGAILAELVFKPADYATALAHYSELRDWSISSGIRRIPGHDCVIAVDSPSRNPEQRERGIIEGADTELGDWVAKLTIGFFEQIMSPSIGTSKQFLTRLPTPAGAHWEGL